MHVRSATCVRVYTTESVGRVPGYMNLNMCTSPDKCIWVKRENCRQQRATSEYTRRSCMRNECMLVKNTE